jgi:hypothetical protein
MAPKGKDSSSTARRRRSSGWEDLLLTFGEALLPSPPVPKYLRSALLRRGPWCWSSVPVEPFSMYMFQPAVAPRDAVKPYAAISHAGHGVNSYGLNVYIVTDKIAIFVQHGWGGVYSNPAREHADIARAYVLVGELLSAERIPTEGRDVVMYSDFRRVACFFRSAPGVILPPKPKVEGEKHQGQITDLVDFANPPGGGKDKDPKLATLERLFAHTARHTAVKESLGRSLEALLRSTGLRER